MSPSRWASPTVNRLFVISPKHIFAGDQHQVSGLRSGNVDLCAQIAAVRFEARPQHRLDQQRARMSVAASGLKTCAAAAHVGGAIARCRDSRGGRADAHMNWRRQPPLADRSRYRTDDVQRIGIDPVQDAARERYVAVIAAGDPSGRRTRQSWLPSTKIRISRLDLSDCLPDACSMTIIRFDACDALISPACTRSARCRRAR